MSTLAELTDRVEQLVADTANAVWDTTWIEEGLRQALHEYSRVRPLTAITTLNIASDTRELDISSITSLLDVREVWVPYTAADPEVPPNRRDFEHWEDDQILYFPGYELQSGEVARVFYTKLQEIEDLDSSTGTTVRADHETLLVTGGAGHVAASRALDISEQVQTTAITMQQVRAWGLGKLQEFRAGLRRIAATDQGTAFVDLPALDRWDRQGWKDPDGQGWT